MFYCDNCAKKEHYAIFFDESFRSLGSCEICNKTRPCNDLKIDMAEGLRDKIILFGDSKNFMKPKNNFIKAPKKHYMTVCFDLKDVFGKKPLFIAAYYVKAFKSKAQAITHMKNLRKSLATSKGWKGTKMGYIYDDKGDLVKLQE